MQKKDFAATEAGRSQMDGLRNKQEEERAGACGEGSGREDQDNTSLRVVLRNTGEASRRME